MTAPVFIYALTDPETGVVGYVGQSIDPKGRVASHLSRSAARAVRAWVRSLAGRPGLVILHRVGPDEDADEQERHYIEHFRQHGQIVNGGQVLNWRSLKEDHPLSAAASALATNAACRGGQRSIAKRLGVDPGVVSRWVNGERLPGATLRGAIEREYGIRWSLWDQPAAQAAP